MSKTMTFAIALALAGVTATGALAASKKHARSVPAYSAYGSKSGPTVPLPGFIGPFGSPYVWSSDDAGRYDPARGYISGD